MAVIEIRGDKALIAQLQRVPGELSKLMLRVGDLYEREVKKNLSNRGRASNALGPRGRPPRNPTAWLRVQTGRLRNSITRSAVRESAGRYQVTVGTNVVYARIHEFGGPAMAWGKHPFVMRKRAFLAPAVEDKSLQAYVAGMVGSRLVAIVRGSP